VSRREVFGQYIAVEGKLSTSDSRKAYVLGPTTTGVIRPIASCWSFAEAVIWAREHDLQNRMIHDGLQHEPVMPGFEEPIAVTIPVHVEDTRTWEELAWDRRYPQYPDGCPECGKKHADSTPCYDGFHPDDDYGPDPAGDS
jgi:hypothetical protein